MRLGLSEYFHQLWDCSGFSTQEPYVVYQVKTGATLATENLKLLDCEV